MAGIQAIEYVLPDTKVTNEELAELFGHWSAEKIYDKTGIHTRHVVKDGETALDLAEAAANKLFEVGKVDKDCIDFLLLNTQSPDYLLPTSACILQERLKLSKHMGALDFNLGCSGFIYGLAVAKSLVGAGIAKNVLLVTAETYSKHIYHMDRSTRTIFGDGAAATVISSTGLEIGSFDLGTDGAGENLLKIPAGGMRLPKSTDTAIVYDEEGNQRTKEHLYMDGTGIFEFTIREIPDSFNRLLQKEDLTKGEVDLIVFHQANKFMLDFLSKQMKLGKEQVYMNFADIGNTVSSTIPIALKRASEEHLLKNNQNIILSGFGVGLSWGTTVLRTGGENAAIYI